MMIAIAVRVIAMMEIRIVISSFSYVQFNSNYTGQIKGSAYPRVPIAYL